LSGLLASGGGAAPVLARGRGVFDGWRGHSRRKLPSRASRPPKMSLFRADHRTDFRTLFLVNRARIPCAGRARCRLPAVCGRCGGLVGGGWGKSRAGRAVAARPAEPSETPVQNRFYVQICGPVGAICVRNGSRRGGGGRREVGTSPGALQGLGPRRGSRPGSSWAPSGLLGVPPGAPGARPAQAGWPGRNRLTISRKRHDFGIGIVCLYVKTILYSYSGHAAARSAWLPGWAPRGLGRARGGPGGRRVGPGPGPTVTKIHD